jgi:hypothetical protein
VIKGQPLRDYWAEVREGIRPPPKRNSATIQRTVNVSLDGSFGRDRDKRLAMTLHQNGRLELRPERCRRSESVMLIDVYRFAIRCRVNQVALTKARERKERKAARLAAQRQARKGKQ